MSEGIAGMQDEPAVNRRTATFAEEDYRFGAGPLRLAVEHVEWARPSQHEGENWYEVTGVEISTDGRVVRRRRALVRGSRLHAWRTV